MQALPKSVLDRLTKLRREHKHHVEVAAIRGHFYVYESTTKWDAKLNKRFKLANYLGRINEDGTFTPAMKRAVPKDLDAPLRKVEVPISAVETKSVQTEGNIGYPAAVPFLNERDKKVLTALSMNGRITMSVLGKITGMKETAAAYQVERLEKLFGIKYIAEIDVQKLGYLSFMVAVKFMDKSPSGSDLKAILDAEPRIQIAMQIHGDQDLLMYILAKSNSEAISLITGLRMRLLECKSKWNLWPIDNHYGTVPLRGAFIDLLKDVILQREYAVLKELNKNGRMEFSEIDKKYMFDTGRAQYSYHKLRESGLLKRVTITMQNLLIKYTAVISASLIDEGRFRRSREGLIRSVIENQSALINKYLLVGDTAAPDGIVFCLPVFGNDDLDKDVEKLNSLNLGMEFTTMIATNLLVGEFCYRCFDNAHTEWQVALEKEYGSEIIEKTDYEETGRHKKSRINYKVDIRGIQIGKEEN